MKNNLVALCLISMLNYSLSFSQIDIQDFLLNADNQNSGTQSLDCKLDDQGLHDKTLNSQCYLQSETIDKLLEATGQAINNNKVHVNDKDIARQTLMKLRKLLAPVLETKNYSPKEVCALNSYILQALELSIKAKFSQISLDSVGSFSPKFENIKRNLNDLNIRQILDLNDKTVNYLFKNMSKLSLSFTSKALNKLEQIDKDWHILAISKRITPYAGLLAYYTFVTRKENLPFFLKPLKNVLGNLAKRTTKTVTTGALSSRRPEDANNSERNNGYLPALTDLELTAESRDTYIPGDGAGGGFFNFSAKVIAFKEEPLYTFAPIALLSPIIKKDLEDFSKWGTQKAKDAYAYLKGETANRSPIKSARGKFRDVVGFDYAKAQLEELLTYYKNKQLLDLVGPALKRGYLIVGPQDIAKDLVYALGGEISLILKDQNKKENCSIYEISSHKLIETPFSDIVKEAEEKAPCIILIKDIDYLDKKSLRAKNWSKLLNTLASTLASASKQIYVFGTATRIEDVYQPLLQYDKLNSVIKIGQPNYEDRKQFFAKELEKSFAQIDEETAILLAKQTANCSYEELKRLITTALNNAQIKKEKLNQSHFREAIDKHIYKIYTDYNHTSPLHKEMTAAYLAGKAIAHSSLSNNEKLVKLTILPIMKNNIIEHGAVITQDREETVLTQNDILNQCKVELAGIIAQDIILNDVDQKQKAKSIESVFEKLLNIHYDGAKAENLTNQIKEEKLQNVWSQIHQYRQEMQNVLKDKIVILNKLFKLLLEKQTLSDVELSIIES